MTENTSRSRSGDPRRPDPHSGRPSRGGAGQRSPRDSAKRRDDNSRGGAGSRGRSDRPESPRRSSSRGESSRPRDSLETTPRHDDPPVDPDVTPRELDRSAWRELMALTKENAEWVAGHLVMASRVVDEDPERAHRHALAAARRAGRIPVVRETVGITAYLLGNFALALRELRTYRRLSGSNDQVPMMVDCERGLGRPQRALELAGEVNRAQLSAPVAVELAIARSGARCDLGQYELALQELEIPQLNPDVAYSYSPALFDSYATILSLLGRENEAETWGELANRAARALDDASDSGDEDMVVVEMPEDESA